MSSFSNFFYFFIIIGPYWCAPEISKYVPTNVKDQTYNPDRTFRSVDTACTYISKSDAKLAIKDGSIISRYGEQLKTGRGGIIVGDCFYLIIYQFAKIPEIQWLNSSSELFNFLAQDLNKKFRFNLGVFGTEDPELDQTVKVYRLHVKKDFYFNETDFNTVKLISTCPYLLKSQKSSINYLNQDNSFYLNFSESRGTTKDGYRVFKEGMVIYDKTNQYDQADENYSPPNEFGEDFTRVEFRANNSNAVRQFIFSEDNSLRNVVSADFNKVYNTQIQTRCINTLDRYIKKKPLNLGKYKDLEPCYPKSISLEDRVHANNYTQELFRNFKEIQGKEVLKEIQGDYQHYTKEFVKKKVSNNRSLEKDRLRKFFIAKAKQENNIDIKDFFNSLLYKDSSGVVPLFDIVKKERKKPEPSDIPRGLTQKDVLKRLPVSAKDGFSYNDYGSVSSVQVTANISPAPVSSLDVKEKQAIYVNHLINSALSSQFSAPFSFFSGQKGTNSDIRFFDSFSSPESFEKNEKHRLTIQKALEYFGRRKIDHKPPDG